MVSYCVNSFLLDRVGGRSLSALNAWERAVVGLG